MLAMFAGCNHDCPDRNRCEPIERGTVDPSGSFSYWVINSLRIAESADDARALGFNLDADELCGSDNDLGGAYAAWVGLLQLAINDGLASHLAAGSIIQLIRVRATSLSDADGVGVTIYKGLDADNDPSNNFTGQAAFSTDDSYSSIELAGDIRGGELSANIGTAPLLFSFSSEVAPVVLSLNAASLDATVDSGLMRGRLGGAHSMQQVQSDLLMNLWASVVDIVQRDCPSGMCAPSSNGEFLLGLFDNDPTDGDVSLPELTTSSTVEALFEPSLDLYDADGRLNPNCDGVDDSNGVAFSFTAVPARLDAP